MGTEAAGVTVLVMGSQNTEAYVAFHCGFFKQKRREKKGLERRREGGSMRLCVCFWPAVM